MLAQADVYNRTSSDTAVLSNSDTLQFSIEAKKPAAPECRIAGRIEEWEAAFRLVYDCYVRKGLITPNETGRRVTKHHLLAATNTFIATQGGSIQCTVTLVGDSEEGLPLEGLYPEEIEQKRMEGLVLGEVSCLASRVSSRRRFLPIFLDLMKLMCQQARCFGLDQLLIAAHPKHARFYEHYMGYRQFGEEKRYESLHDAPAVACCLDFEDIDRRRPHFYDHVFGEKLQLWQLLPQPMPPHAVAHFAPMVEAGAELLPIFA